MVVARGGKQRQDAVAEVGGADEESVNTEYLEEFAQAFEPVKNHKVFNGIVADSPIAIGQALGPASGIQAKFDTKQYN